MWFTVLEKMKIPDYSQHKLLWGFFPGVQQSQGERPFCFRDTGDQILMLSNVEPATESKKIEFEAGKTLMFECRTCPNDSNVGGVKVKAHTYSADKLKKWFKDRFDGAADINYVMFKKLSPHVIQHQMQHRKIVYSQIMFYGTLTILNAEKFAEIVGRGIGQGGSFGFGAMILPQVMQ